MNRTAGTRWRNSAGKGRPHERRTAARGRSYRCRRRRYSSERSKRRFRRTHGPAARPWRHLQRQRRRQTPPPPPPPHPPTTTPPPPPDPMVGLRALGVTFSGSGGGKPVRAISGVSLQVQRGEVLALIGESGSGKSVTMRTLLRLHPERRTRIDGLVEVAGRAVLALSQRELADFRGKVASMIFQEPLLALDPVYPIGAQIVESIRRHESVTRAEARQRALALFERVQIPSPERRLAAYPHELSGGMRQRAMIALALACQPQLLLADEPTTALDATVQIQILLLLRQLQRDLGLSVIFVTHDIGAAVEVADRIAVMYAGRIVEEGTVRELLGAPRHPYTIALLKSSAHGALARGTRLATIAGAPPDLCALPPGCAFAERCALARAACHAAPPPMVEIAPNRRLRCIHTDAAPLPGRRAGGGRGWSRGGPAGSNRSAIAPAERSVAARCGQGRCRAAAMFRAWNDRLAPTDAPARDPPETPA